MRSFEESADLVKLDTGSNGLYYIIIRLYFSLSSRDISTIIVGTSEYVGSKFVSKEDGSLPGGTDSLNRISTSELTANRKPGGGKRKRVEESDDESMWLTKKRGAGT